MSSQCSIKRIPLGEIQNLQPQQVLTNQCKSIESLTSPPSRISRLQEKMSDFYFQCHEMLNKNQREFQIMFENVQKIHNTYLLEMMEKSREGINTIKNVLETELAKFNQFSFIDRGSFLTKRPTGDIELTLLSNQTLTTSHTTFYDLSTIKGLKISNTILTQSQISQIVKTLPHLQQLNLYQCAIDDQCANIIALNLPLLRRLDLEWNLIGDTGASTISKKLKKLKHLNLYLNNIGDQGAKCLVNNLKSLKSLNLESNELTPQTSRYVGSVMSSYKF